MAFAGKENTRSAPSSTRSEIQHRWILNLLIREIAQTNGNDTAVLARFQTAKQFCEVEVVGQALQPWISVTFLQKA